MYKLLASTPVPSRPPGHQWDPNRAPDLDPSFAGVLAFLVVVLVVGYFLYQRAKRNPNDNGW